MSDGGEELGDVPVHLAPSHARVAVALSQHVGIHQKGQLKNPGQTVQARYSPEQHARLRAHALTSEEQQRHQGSVEDQADKDEGRGSDPVQRKGNAFWSDAVEVEGLGGVVEQLGQPGEVEAGSGDGGPEEGQRGGVVHRPQQSLRGGLAGGEHPVLGVGLHAPRAVHLQVVQSHAGG